MLLLQPPAQAAGAMDLEDLQNRVWSLLREKGPDQGFPPPTLGDFSQAVVTRDLNIALAQFMSATGCAPMLNDRQVVLPVLVMPNGDYPVPPDLEALYNIEYTPQGQQTYRLEPLSFEAWYDRFGNVLPPTTGQPYFYRQMFAGYIRLQPAPSLGNAVGTGTGAIGFTGGITPGQHVTVNVSDGVHPPITTVPYVVANTDTLATIAFAVAGRIAQSAACSGASAFLAPPSPVAGTIMLTALTAPGTGITYSVGITGAGLLVGTPTSSTNLNATGDTMTWYYSSSGKVLSLLQDTPGMPPQFHMALVYRVLADYWKVKQDIAQSREYAQEFIAMVKEARAYEWDANRDSGPEWGYDDVDYSGWPDFR